MNCLTNMFNKKKYSCKKNNDIDNKNTLVKKNNDNDIYYRSMNKHNKDPDIKHIKQIIFDGYCRESDPCGHSYTLVLNDDTHFTSGGNGIQIAYKYWDLLSQKDKYHFEEYKDNIDYRLSKI